MTDQEYYEKAVARAENNTPQTKVLNFREIIIFLEKEIGRYREKINCMDAYIEGKHKRIAELERLVHKLYGECIKIEPTTQLDAVKESTAAEIIKALADNGYNTITINCYKDIESEGN